jgi:glycine cleavage system pyridoxal-binding protein P
MGRPATRPGKLKDGFYIEILNKGAKKGIKLYRDSEKQMLIAIEEYKRTKDILVLGESKNNKFISKSKFIKLGVN